MASFNGHMETAAKLTAEGANLDLQREVSVGSMCLLVRVCTFVCVCFCILVCTCVYRHCLLLVHIFYM